MYIAAAFFCMKHLPIHNQLFVENRKRFAAKMLPNTIAIFVSNDETPVNGDALFTYQQNSDVYWLTGIEQEGTMVVLYPDAYDKTYQEIVIVTRPNELKEKWDGKRLRAHQATEISGIKTVIWADSADAVLQQLIHLADGIYLDSNENDRKATLIPTADDRFIASMKQRYPLHTYYRAAKILTELRAVKTSWEVAVLQQAIDITAQTFTDVLKMMQPGVMEYQVEATIHHGFLSRRAAGPAYNCIIASGDNARILHYVENNQPCNDGDLLLLDFGAKYGGYCADLTRTIPVNGQFTKRQKQVYNAVLAIHDYAKSSLKPGISIVDYTNKVGEEATQQMIKIGLLTKADVKNQDPANPAYRKYLYHGISHHLGIDVHDVGTRTKPITPGMVFTVEPGIYIEEEKMGIRIENNVWITKKGNQDLMAHIPITAADIELSFKQAKAK